MSKLVAVLALACSGAAWAQTGELWFSAGQSLLSSSGIGTLQAFGGAPNDVQLTDGFRFSFRFGFNQGSHFGHEVQYAYNRTQLKQVNTLAGQTTSTEQGMAYHQGGYNFLYYFIPEGSRVRPFGTAGIHFSDYVPPGSSVSYGGGSNKPGFNYGAGVKIRTGSLFGIRFDVRQYINGKPFGLPMVSGVLRQTEISAGFGIGF